MCAFRFEKWPTEFRGITQPFGVNAAFYGAFGLPGHEGIDFQAPEGSRVFAVAPGRVSFVQRTIGTPQTNPYGLHVIVDHEEGYQTVYGHLSDLRARMNTNVAAGHLLGLAGNTGNSQGAHLHLTLKKRGAQFENWPNNIVDPTRFVLPHLGWQEPAGPFTAGWAFTIAITVFDDLAQVNASPISLRRGPQMEAERIAVVPAGTMMRVTGEPQGDYTPVDVPNAAIGLPAGPTPVPSGEPAPTVATVDGWGFAPNLNVGAGGNRAAVTGPGINLRAEPRRDATNIGLVRSGSTVLVRGEQRGEYVPVRASLADFQGPVNLPQVAPAGAGEDEEDVFLGWAFTQGLELQGEQAVTNQFGINLRARPQTNAGMIGLVKGMAVVRLAGQPQGEYTPVRVRRQDFVELTAPDLEVAQPDPLPAGGPPPPEPPAPIHDTTPGWAFTAAMTVTDGEAVAGELGINLRAAPRRDGENVGFVPGGARLIVTGAAQGEYTPVRVDDEVLQPPFQPQAAATGPAAAPASPGTEEPAAPPAPAPSPDPPLLGSARIGLHCSADPFIPEQEFVEMRQLRPGVIKVLSFHSREAIARLAAENPDAHFLLRAFLSFGGRNISPNQFFNDTISDVRRSLDALQGRDVVVELHNEPNLTLEGLGATWRDGAAFNAWWLRVLQLYRQALPGVRFIYPGLSPGGAVDRVRQEHTSFLEASRTAVEAADGLGVHTYWAHDFPMERALQTLDGFIRRFPAKPIWVTEASNNKGHTSPQEKGREYLRFWQKLQQRPTVQGVTYFVASASDPQFAEEVWVGRGIAAVVGAR